MSFLDRLLKQTATYWSPSGTPFNAYGDPGFVTPVILSPDTGTGIRWEDRVEKIINDREEISFTKAWVWSATTVFVTGGYLLLGSTATSNPETAGAHQIIRVLAVPDVKGQKTLYKAIL